MPASVVELVDALDSKDTAPTFYICFGVEFIGYIAIFEKTIACKELQRIWEECSLKAALGRRVNSSCS